jgi:hypothetical protein
MSSGTRRAVFLPAAAVVAAVLVWGLTGLPGFGHYRGPYGLVLNDVAVQERHMTNVVTAVVFDYRGFDTLGEEFILPTFNRSSQRFVVDLIVNSCLALPLVSSSRVSYGVGC